MFNLSESLGDSEILKNLWDSMAIKHLRVKRFNAGGRAVPAHAHARYLLFDMSPKERQAHMSLLSHMEMHEHVKHMWRERPLERPREDLVASGSRHLPAFAQGDALAYWEAAQAYTRKASASRGRDGKPLSKGGVVAKELEISLPRELTQAQNQALIQQWLDTLPAYPLTWAFHEPQTRSGDHPQPHVHILISPRPDDGQARDAQTYFRQQNHGGVPASQLWTTRTAMQRLHHDWDTFLRARLREHGLEHTLVREHRGKELALQWDEMKNLERLIHKHEPTWWGHEYKIPAQQIRTWQDQGTITLRQATWIAVRGQRQLDYRYAQREPQLWDYGTRLEAARTWQLVAKHQARQGRKHVEQALATMRQQQRALGQCQTWLAPRLREQQAAYRDRQQKERERSQGLGRTRGRGLRQQGHGRSPVQLEAVDARMDEQRRSERQGWER